MTTTPLLGNFHIAAIPVIALCCAVTGHAAAPASASVVACKATPGTVLWKAPAEIETRDLFYGAGGRQDQPQGVFTFAKEDLDGTNPKMTVRDLNGVKWKVKLGSEARPETAASRLVWAVGYYADEDYFVPELMVENLPGRLRRGQKFVSGGGSLHHVRLKRYPTAERKVGHWRWADAQFAGTREWNGLRTMMALINNWDLTDENTAIYQTIAGQRSYEVSDLGSSFGAGRLTWPLGKCRDNLHCYRNSKFAVRVTADFVDFDTPRRDSLVFLATPREFFQKLRLRWLARNIPRGDARWMGQLLARLSPDQIRDGFRSAGYSPREIEGFTLTVQERIRQLQQL